MRPFHEGSADVLDTHVVWVEVKVAILAARSFVAESAGSHYAPARARGEGAGMIPKKVDMRVCGRAAAG
jgi:hypothetical protein